MEHETKPRPASVDFEKRAYYKSLWSNGQMPSIMIHEAIEFENSFCWGPERFFDNCKCGLKTLLGEILVPPVFEDFDEIFDEIKKGDKVIAKENSKWGVVLADGIGTWFIKPEFDFIGKGWNLRHVCKNDRWGVLDITKGEFLILPDCDKVFDYDGYLLNGGGIGIYERNGKIGIILDDGSFTEPLYEGEDVYKGFVTVKFNGQWGFLNKERSFTTKIDEAYYCYQLP